ncbi:hypothetical protein J2Z40_001121 [Cytobacillus eiseniae]|uniref:Spore coat protein n=2 Tax=Cytobacillus eiseniae TaxID=762947 RepID=A0ABS4RCD7_9BACI|nr:hypothetical protein [Cytobacillus eiseniae]
MPTQSQMPLMPTEGVKGAEADCGCGGGAPQMAPYGYGQGFPHAGHGAFPYGAPYGHQMGYGQPMQMMNPYGYGPMGGQAFGMPRGFDESSEFDV